MALRRILVLHVLLSLFCLTLSAQDLSVRSMELLPNDATASMEDFQRQDLNGNYAGVVKVMLAVSGATFEGGGVLEQQKHMDGEYWVWLAKDSKRIKVHAPGYLPLELNFFNDYKFMIESKRTYKLVITVPVIGQVQQDDGMSYLALTVEPSNAQVVIDGSKKDSKDGEYMLLLTRGNHFYEVSSPGYAPQSGSVLIDKEKKSLTVRLISTKAQLKVECPTKGAQVYVNDQLKGTVPWTGSLNADAYRVEVRKDGYRSQSQTVSLSENGNRTLNFPALIAVTGSMNVAYKPMGSDVYIDGQKVGTTPDIFRNVGVGTHKVEIRKEGYVSVIQTVTVKENGTLDVSGELTPNSTSTTANISNSTSTTASSAGSTSNKTFTVNGVSFTMVYIEGGTFTMGATSEQGSEAKNNEKPAHSVTLSSYHIGETEVTQELWQAVMGNNPSYFTGNDNLPVEQVSWEDGQAFISKLNSLTGESFHLPTEAQWEYAARGGKKNRGRKYSGRNSVNDIAWYAGNSFKKTHSVKTKYPNELGIYNMSGNVWEWCQDWYDSYSISAQKDSIGTTREFNRVLRGGSFDYDAGYCRTSSRSSNTPSFRSFDLGLRLAL